MSNTFFQGEGIFLGGFAPLVTGLVIPNRHPFSNFPTLRHAVRNCERTEFVFAFVLRENLKIVSFFSSTGGRRFLRLVNYKNTLAFANERCSASAICRHTDSAVYVHLQTFKRCVIITSQCNNVRLTSCVSSSPGHRLVQVAGPRVEAAGQVVAVALSPR